MQKTTSASSAAQPPSRRKAPKPVPWRSMSATERRVAVAKDVLALLRSRQAPEIIEGNYCEGLPLPYVYDKNLDSYEENRRALHEVLEPALCAVCARGAAFLSAVRLFNQVTVYEAETESDYKGPRGLSLKLFGARTVGLIEYAFEGEDASAETMGMPHSDQQRCIAFYRAHREPKARLRAIMENVVANNGRFIP